MIVVTVLLALLCLPAQARPPDPFEDPAYPLLVEAYDALNGQDYDNAIMAFRRAIEMSPERAHVHKDLAYALLKIGENLFNSFGFMTMFALSAKAIMLSLVLN